MRFVKSIDAFHDMTCSLGQSGIYLYSILVQSCTRAECASGQLNSVVCDTAVQWTAWEPYGGFLIDVVTLSVINFRSCIDQAFS